MSAANIVTGATDSLLDSVLTDGRPTDLDTLGVVAFGGFAHFTAMQVRDGAVRGLDLHVDRVVDASRRLFGAELAPERVRSDLRAALASAPPDLSLTMTVFDSHREFTNEPVEPLLRTMVRKGPPSSGPEGPLALGIFEHERFMPEIKQVGEGAKTYFMRRARDEGFDDAAFVDREGRVSEASIWNLAFWDGEAVVWPRAEILTGTTMGILQRRLESVGIEQRTETVRVQELSTYQGAAVINSWTAGIEVRQVGETPFAGSSVLVKVLRDAYENEPPVQP